jgi:hypothetical protein
MQPTNPLPNNRAGWAARKQGSQPGAHAGVTGCSCMMNYCESTAPSGESFEPSHHMAVMICRYYRCNCRSPLCHKYPLLSALCTALD